MEYQKIEECIQKKNELFAVDEKDVMAYANRVEEANKEAIFVSTIQSFKIFDTQPLKFSKNFARNSTPSLIGRK